MRSKLVLALILFGSVAVTTASASMPQKADSLSQKFSIPDCNCKDADGRFGLWDGSQCNSSAWCVVPVE